MSAAIRTNITSELRSKINNLDQLNPIARHIRRNSSVFSVPKKPVEMDPFTNAHQSVGSTNQSGSTIVLETTAKAHVELNDRVSRAIFEVARTEVYQLMCRDSFKRWVAKSRHSERETIGAQK